MYSLPAGAVIHDPSSMASVIHSTVGIFCVYPVYNSSEMLPTGSSFESKIVPPFMFSVTVQSFANLAVRAMSFSREAMVYSSSALR